MEPLLKIRYKLSPVKYLILCLLLSFVMLSPLCTSTPLQMPSKAAGISNAVLLQRNHSYKKHIEANQTCYYYIKPVSRLSLSISSSSAEKLKLSFFSETGASLSISHHRTGNTRTFKIETPPKGDKLFISIFNQQSYSASFRIMVSQISIQHKKNEAKATPSTKKTSPVRHTAKPAEYILYPQFLALPPKAMRTMTIKNMTPSKIKKCFRIISTNPIVAKTNPTSLTVTTHKEGVAVIYLWDKKRHICTSSCFIRVIRQ